MENSDSRLSAGTIITRVSAGGQKVDSNIGGKIAGQPEGRFIANVPLQAIAPDFSGAAPVGASPGQAEVTDIDNALARQPEAFGRQPSAR